jgi:hypothetical protein
MIMLRRVLEREVMRMGLDQNRVKQIRLLVLAVLGLQESFNVINSERTINREDVIGALEAMEINWKIYARYLTNYSVKNP